MTGSPFSTYDTIPLVDGIELADDHPHIHNANDDTKQLRFEVGGISPDTVRVVTVPDQDISLSPGTDFAAAAHTHSGLAPAGGAQGYVLKKTSAADYDYDWAADDAAGSGSVAYTQRTFSGTIAPDANVEYATYTQSGAVSFTKGTGIQAGAAHILPFNSDGSTLTWSADFVAAHDFTAGSLPTTLPAGLNLLVFTYHAARNEVLVSWSAVSAAEVDFTPAGNISATNVQAAIEELDTEKAMVGHNHAGLAPAGGASGTVLKKSSATDYDFAWNAVAIADVTDLQTALDGKASTTHNHAISDVTGLQTALDGKASTTHNHDATYAPLSHTHDLTENAGLSGNRLIGATELGELMTHTGAAATWTFNDPGKAGIVAIVNAGSGDITPAAGSGVTVQGASSIPSGKAACAIYHTGGDYCRIVVEA